MAIALVGSRTLYDGSVSGDPHEFSFTVGAGANLLVVKVCWEDTAPSPTLDDVRWGGSGGTQLTLGISRAYVGNNRTAAIWYLVNPTVTTQNVWLDFSAAVSITVEVLALSGGATTGTIADAGSNDLSGTSITTEAALVPDGADNWLETCVIAGAHTTTFTAQGSATETNESTNTGGFGGGFEVAFSTQASISANITPGWTSSGSSILVMAAVLIKPPTVVPRKFILTRPA